ncbi:MAG TPA: MBL fold metallo-hydrolase [Gemmatimonadota bacterium]|nr:MBL fold metallo-hydrolase [Gemmatimonadota bacterium]
MTDHGDFEITPRELADRLEGGEAMQVLDIRAPHRLAAGVVEAERFFNVRGSELMSGADPAEAGLDPDAPVVVVCGHGNSSQPVTHYLRMTGWTAQSLKGGVTAWMNLLRQRVLATPEGVDHFVQFDRVGKGSLGYLIVSGEEALAVDPSRHWSAWRDAAREAGARLVGTADTHVHADFISGSPRLSHELGVPYYLHPADNVYPYDGTPGRLAFEPVEHGEVIRVGRAEVRVDHTPGHTEGSVSLHVADDVVLTGDFLFVASIGRPDLAGKTEEWAGALWESLVRARDGWPKEVVVYPAHYGSAEERNSDLSVGRPLADLMARNPTLSIETEAEFRDTVERRVSTPPDVYRTIKTINVGLVNATPDEAQVLEAGKNECALG